MKFGLFSMNTGPCSFPESAARMARLAEEAGFESLWAGEHVVLPDPQVPPSPLAPEDRILDPIVALTFLATHTSKICLGTGIIILPQHNPLLLAKELASLDVLSGGRLIFGMGVGYLEPEMRALGVSMTDRGARADEYLAAIHAIWTLPKPAYHGRFVSFEGIQAHPRPRQDLPLVIGGHTASAYRRAVQMGNGWYGFSLDPQRTARALAGLEEARGRFPRPASLGELEISVTPRGPVTPETVKQFADLGVHRLILMPPSIEHEDDLREFITKIGETVI